MTSHTPQQLAERLVEMQVLTRARTPDGYLFLRSQSWNSSQLIQDGNVAFAALDALQARDPERPVDVVLLGRGQVLGTTLPARTSVYQKAFSKGGCGNEGTGPEALIRAVVQAWEAGG